jgi:hypothetical protein
MLSGVYTITHPGTGVVSREPATSPARKLQCATGFGDCNQKAADGCETEIPKDKHNCG